MERKVDIKVNINGELFHLRLVESTVKNIRNESGFRTDLSRGIFKYYFKNKSGIYTDNIYNLQTNCNAKTFKIIGKLLSDKKSRISLTNKIIKVNSDFINIVYKRGNLRCAV